MARFVSIILFWVSILTAQLSHASVSANEVFLDTNSWYWINAFSFASTELGPVQDGGGSFRAYNYISFNIPTTYGQHWALRIPFSYQTAGFDDFNNTESQKQEVSLNDILIDYSVSSTLLPGDIEVFSRVRWEIPTSESSLRQKRIGALRLDFIGSRNLTKDFQLEFWPIFTWNLQTQSAYQNPDTGRPTSTQIYELKQRLTLWYRAHKDTFIGFYVGTEDNWYNDSEVNETSRTRFNNLSEHSLKLGPSVRFTLNRNFSFLFNVQNMVDLWGYSPDRRGEVSDLGKFKADQTQVVLLSFINF